MNKKSSDFGIIFWIHLILIAMIYTAPLLFNWLFVLACVGLFYLQLMIFGDCILTKAQFHQKIASFHTYYLKKIGIHINQKKIKILRLLIPTTLFLITLFWQIKLKRMPLFF